MKKKLISLLAVVGMMVSLIVLPQTAMAASTFSGGTGTSDDPYLIATAADLQQLATDVNSLDGMFVYSSTYFKMTQDIDLSSVCSSSSGTSWTPIGNYTNMKCFAGIFDGDGHAIKGLYINDSSLTVVGLFGLTYGGEIKNLTVEGSVTGASYVGGIVGYTGSGIQNCTNKATVTCTGTGNSSYVGGICGAIAEGGVMEKCKNLGDVSGGLYAGGIGGNGYIRYCYNFASVKAGDGGYAGGISGYCDGGNDCVKYCYNQGSGAENTGTAGIVGKADATTTIAYCYYSKVYGSQVGIGSAASDIENCAEVASDTDLKRGEITYLMNTDDQDSPVWYQKLSNDDDADSYPVLNDSARGQVYRITFVMSKDTDEYGYANYGGTSTYVTGVITDHTGWYTSDGAPFTEDTAVTGDMTVTQELGGWITGSDAGYYAEAKDSDSKEGIVRFLAEYSFADETYITSSKIKSYGIWFLKTSDDTVFETGVKASADTDIDTYHGIYADITGITSEDTTCYAKAYIEYDPDGDGTYEYMYSDLITQKADFTKWLGAKTTSGGINQGVGED